MALPQPAHSLSSPLRAATGTFSPLPTAASTPPLAQEILAASLSPSLIALIGFEIEIAGFRITPFFPKGTVLLRGRHWRLETDWFPNTERADLEFVLAPMRDIKQVERVADEVISLIRQIADRTNAAPGKTLPLAAILPDCRLPCSVSITGGALKARLQPTYGIGLAQMHRAIDFHYTRAIARAVHDASAVVAAYFLRHHGVPLTARAAGFVELVNLYLHRAVGVKGKIRMPKVNFLLMARSDFCAIFAKLLDPHDAAQLRWLLLPSTDAAIAPWMQALSLGAQATVFKQPYFDKQYRRAVGPTVREWFASIVYGRPEGRWKKDLLSPPPGMPIHSGDLDQDFGMGAMGVDEVNGLILFEIRSGPQRGKDLRIDASMRYAILHEYANARLFNPTLDPLDRSQNLSVTRLLVLHECEALHEQCARQFNRLRRCYRDDAAPDWRALMATIQRLRHSADACRQMVAYAAVADPALAFSPTLESTARVLQRWLDALRTGCGVGSDSDAAAALAERLLNETDCALASFTRIASALRRHDWHA